MEKAARRFFGGPGGFFNLGLSRASCGHARCGACLQCRDCEGCGACGTCASCAEASLLQALESDGRRVPAHLTASLGLDRVLTTERVRMAWRARGNYTMPGLDGFTTEYFRLFA